MIPSINTSFGNNVTLKVSHRFGWLVRTLRKRQTIRRTLKCTPGDFIRLEFSYYDAEGLKNDHIYPLIKSVHGLFFDHHGVIMDGRNMTEAEAGRFAREDGFIDFTEMQEWFSVMYGQKTFTGFCIRW